MADPFRSERLIYRAVELPDDLDFYISMESDSIANANSNLSLAKPASRAGTEKFLKDWPEKALLFVLVCLPPEPGVANTTDAEKKESKPKLATPVGMVCLGGGSDTMRHHRSSMIGVGIHQDYRGKGYGTEAIEWIMNWGFEVAGLHRIRIGTASYNIGAKKLYERMGFVLESTQREALWFHGGWHDLIEWALLEHEWRERAQTKAGK